MYTCRVARSKVPRSDAISKQTCDMESLMIVAGVWNKVPLFPFGDPPPSFVGSVQQPSPGGVIVVVMPESLINGLAAINAA